MGCGYLNPGYRIGNFRRHIKGIGITNIRERPIDFLKAFGSNDKLLLENKDRGQSLLRWGSGMRFDIP